MSSLLLDTKIILTLLSNISGWAKCHLVSWSNEEIWGNLWVWTDRKAPDIFYSEGSSPPWPGLWENQKHPPQGSCTWGDLHCITPVLESCDRWRCISQRIHPFDSVHMNHIQYIPSAVDKPARLTIRVLWFLFLIVKSEVKKQIGRRWHCLLLETEIASQTIIGS